MSRSACDSTEMVLRVVAVFARQWEQCEYLVKGYRDGFVGKGAGKLEWSDVQVVYTWDGGLR